MDNIQAPQFQVGQCISHGRRNTRRNCSFNLEAKKGGKPGKPPPEPAWEWSVEIPGQITAAALGENLFANPTDPYEITHLFTNEGFTTVRAAINPSNSVFNLWIENDAADEERIGFQGLELEDSGLETSGDCPCNFPCYVGVCPYQNPCGGDPDCLDPDPTCMETFLETYAHPSTDYIEIRLQIHVYGNLAVMGVGDSDLYPGAVWVDNFRSFGAQRHGCDGYHGVAIWNEDADLQITRLDIDTWEVSVIAEEDSTLTSIFEIYEEGKSRNGPSVLKFPISATFPFAFTGTWTLELVE